MTTLWLWLLTSLGFVSAKSVVIEMAETQKFGTVEIVRQSAEPKLMVFLIYSDPDWKYKGERIANSVARDGNVAVLINLQSYHKQFGFCESITNDIDEVNKNLQQKFGFAHPVPIVLLGKDRGANVVELAFDQSGTETFSAFMSIAPCQGTLNYPLCKIDHHLPAFAVHEPFSCDVNNVAEKNALTEVMKAHRSLRLQSWIEKVKDRIYSQVSTGPKGENQIATVEMFPKRITSDRLVVMYSGDGGWARLVRSLAERFTADGIPVVGIDSLKYFWKKKSPADASRDLNTLLKKYSERFHVKKVQLVGFSFGADVLPFIYENLEPEYRGQIDRLTLISLGKFADFEFHLDDWVSNENSGFAIRPEVEKIGNLKVDCAYGEETKDESLCPDLLDTHVNVLKFPGGHFLNWDIDGLYRKIVN